jgi:hypothetical protein
MNLLSFVDELVKVGAVSCMYKRGADITNTEIPAAMMSPDHPPPFHRLAPDEAATRLPNAGLPSQVQTGTLGTSSGAKDPVDQQTRARLYAERSR